MAFVSGSSLPRPRREPAPARCPLHMIRAPPTAPSTAPPVVPPSRVTIIPSLPTPPSNQSPVSAVAAAAAAAAAKHATVQLPISPPVPDAPPTTPQPTIPISEAELLRANPPQPRYFRRNRDDCNMQVLDEARQGDLVREDYLTTTSAPPAPAKAPARTSRRKKGSSSRKASVIDPRISHHLASKPANRNDLEQDASAASEARESSGADSIRSYLKEIGDVKLLDADKEVALARQIATLLALERISARFKNAHGRHPTVEEWAHAASTDPITLRNTLRSGLRAREHMVAANLRLVVSIAKRYLNRGLTFQDLIQEGSIGLIRGAEKFDGNKGFKFSTYATWWIRQAITRAIADHSRTIRLPVHVNDTIASIRKTSKILFAELCRPPTEFEIAARLQMSVEKLRFLTKSSRATLSLETPISKDMKGSSATLGSFIEWEGDTPEDAIMKSLLREDLETVLNTLSPRERDVIRMRYGFDDGKMKTLEEIGTFFAVTRERIRQIEAKALRKLRHPTRNAVLREYVYEA
eukprot:TRINITY_DN4535_c0_g1_i1.p1 TRINITY_DN4535_c0_g1~~TRINITY_DN4535_c0_g1_i1.p1  ORF type:complete len:585 (-),score=105.01 TRINITY_DN4535_c0_g1_i1:1356-2927(-)